MQSLYNLIYDRPGKQPATKPSKHADEQPIKNDQILRTKLKRKMHFHFLALTITDSCDSQRPVQKSPSISSAYGMPNQAATLDSTPQVSSHLTRSPLRKVTSLSMT